MNNNDMPDTFFSRNASAIQKSRVKISGMGGIGLGDYPENFIDEVQPAPVTIPIGPANFPVSTDPNATMTQLLQNILDELVRQNTAARPVIRSSLAGSTGATLNWDSVGVMDRLMMRNSGPQSVWFSFDRDGSSVQAFTSDESFELQANESVNLTHCIFSKIGLKCAGGGAATVNSVAFQTVAGNQGAAIS